MMTNKALVYNSKVEVIKYNVLSENCKILFSNQVGIFITENKKHVLHASYFIKMKIAGRFVTNRTVCMYVFLFTLMYSSFIV